ncbi:ABC transporter ATP-binding protein [Virgisporangium aurantiacum]|uniref:ABC transporter ATP-binding protein n=1 Tax=Virgisporangium aurantiacum TaxID=175570 RepID=A0A8J3Z759_9ACTN|nr:ABC transporter ATP-binding protein [Virgisporangium aurantiacum]GIJ57637.1 ABC transporter ATP-binding protein [Virgisporangium aurantiacum]
MLRVRDLNAWYGEARVLRDVSLDVETGTIVTLVGRNGAGKTTLLRCLMGLHRQQRGDITYDDHPIHRLAPHKRPKRGIGWVPDDRGIYTSLTVEENLTLPPRSNDDAWPLGRVYETFPVLRERRRYPGTRLSGGEQQMLAIARMLRTGARLLLCDEPTEGLAPILVRQIAEILHTVREHGVTVLLIEQNLQFATTVADRHYLLAEGRIAESLDNSEVEARQHELLEYLGI